MILSDLWPEDLEALFLAWPRAATDARWRLGGQSSSPALLNELLTHADRQQVLRGAHGRALGILQVCEADRAAGIGYLCFMVPQEPPSEPLLLSFLRESLDLLELRTLCIQVDEDELGVLEGMRPHLRQVGCLGGHTRQAYDRYLDRLIFEFGVDVGAECGER